MGNKEDIRKILGQNMKREASMVRVNQEGLSSYGYRGPELLNLEEARVVFNRMSERFGAKPLREPWGYMALEDSFYNVMKDTYADFYDEHLEKIENGMGLGSPRAFEAVLDTLDKRVLKDMKSFEGDQFVYGDLRFLPVTDTLQEQLDDFVKTRVLFSAAHSIKRSVSDDRLEELKGQLRDKGLGLRDTIHETVKELNQKLMAEQAVERTMTDYSVFEAAVKQVGEKQEKTSNWKKPPKAEGKKSQEPKVSKEELAAIDSLVASMKANGPAKADKGSDFAFSMDLDLSSLNQLPPLDASGMTL